MTKTKLRPLLPYVAVHVIGIALLLTQAGRVDPFIMLRCELLVIFGFSASIGDIRARKIPNSLILAMISAWILIMAPKILLDTEAAIMLLADSAIGFAIGGGMFLLMYFISRKGLGGGDVKFMAASGLFLGARGVFPAMLCGSILAALTGLALILLKKFGRKDTMPLAPFLYAGILITSFMF